MSVSLPLLLLLLLLALQFPFARSFLAMLCMSLGIQLPNGTMLHLANRGQVLPMIGSQLFTTCMDNQTIVQLNVYQGESSQAKENFFVGSLNLELEREEPQGVPQILFRFKTEENWRASRTFTYLDVLGRNQTRQETSYMGESLHVDVSVKGSNTTNIREGYFLRYTQGINPGDPHSKADKHIEEFTVWPSRDRYKGEAPCLMPPQLLLLPSPDAVAAHNIAVREGL